MPEGHKLHRLARDHRRDFRGRRVSVRSPQGRFADGAALLEGRELQDVAAVGKHLLYAFGSDLNWHVHLGLYGKFRPFRGAEPEVRGQVRVAFCTDNGGFHLVGPNQCDVLSDTEVQTLRERLGPDPLDPRADVRRFVTRVRKSRAAIGQLLLDQSVIAGVGNIYRADVLFRMGVHPLVPGRDVPEETLRLLWDLIVQLMRLGVKYNRIITADPARVGKTAGRLSRHERLLIYKADRCPECLGEVEHFQVAGRRIDACPQCQPLGEA